MKINYFYLILRQEQGWFDENNAFEFATKVQAQLEQIEMGVGDRFGQIILMLSELVSGFIIGFISSLVGNIQLNSDMKYLEYIYPPLNEKEKMKITFGKFIITIGTSFVDIFFLLIKANLQIICISTAYYRH